MKLAGRAIAASAAIVFSFLAYAYLTLPDTRPLKTSNPSTTAFMERRAREARAKGQEPRRVQRWVTYNQISADLKRAVLVAEDDAFWQHEGVDLDQIQQSLEIDWARGSFVRGASTVTQQLAKNLYLSPSKNPVRKLRELIIARRLEAELEKARILELYLNVIEWGDGIYGADAAAQAYFHAPASALGPVESALLAGAIANPRVLSPARPSARLIRRQQLILRRMRAVVPPVESVEPPAGEPVAPEPEGPAAPESTEPAEPVVPEPAEPIAPEPAQPITPETLEPIVPPPADPVVPARAAPAERQAGDPGAWKSRFLLGNIACTACFHFRPSL